MRSDIVPGGHFPNYELPDHTGKVRKLMNYRAMIRSSSRSRGVISVQRSTSSI
jgi:hypothetical protein